MVREGHGRLLGGEEYPRQTAIARRGMLFHMSRTRRQCVGWTLAIVSLLLVIAWAVSTTSVVRWNVTQSLALWLSSGGVAVPDLSRLPGTHVVHPGWPDDLRQGVCPLVVVPHLSRSRRSIDHLLPPPLALHPPHRHPFNLAPGVHPQDPSLLRLPTRRAPARLAVPGMRRSMILAEPILFPFPTSPLPFSPSSG